MHFVSLTLQRPTAIIKAAYGHYSNAKAHEIVVAKRGAVELLRPDETTGKMVSVSVTPVFASGVEERIR
jgi:splicing factor 3B subunit 3